jgi:hypothetical protein
MLAYDNDQEKKNKYVMRMRIDIDNQKLHQGGVYWSDYDQVGCAVGLIARSYNYGEQEIHHRVGKLLTIPANIVYLLDRLYEDLPPYQCVPFALNFLKAIPVGADLTHVNSHFIIWLLSDPQEGAITLANDPGVTIIRQVVDLHQQVIQGKDVTSTQWNMAMYEAEMVGCAPARIAASEYSWDTYQTIRVLRGIHFLDGFYGREEATMTLANIIVQKQADKLLHLMSVAS